ncbi:MAG: heparinase II/III family protein [Planctomycetota bacterium]
MIATRLRTLCLSIVISILLGGTAVAKTGSVTITAKMRANAKTNIEKYDWAKSAQRAAIQSAEKWIKIPDRDLWLMVTPQTLPRTIHTTRIRYTNRTAMCPNCGPKIIPFGNYPWKIDWFKKPWKLECPACKETYPKNDFWAYYLSALDERGVFQQGKGDPKLLFNADRPDPKDPLHKFAVDDGYGWYDDKDDRWAFAAYYNSWGQWQMIARALGELARAYTLTENKQYSRKAGILLDRIADVYPDMDLYEYIHKMLFEHSDGSSGGGRIEGCIWETRNGVAFSTAYDHVFDGMKDDPELVKFLSQMAKDFKIGDKSGFEAIQRNIEENLILEVVKSVKDGRIAGNEGMHQNAMVAAAIALDREPLTTELLDWVFLPGKRAAGKDGRRPLSGGGIPFILMNKMCRDGMGDEGAPGYSCWGITLMTTAELLRTYPKYTNHSMYRDFPKYKQCFLTPIRWACLGQATPSIGDSGACGNWGGVGVTWETLLNSYRAYRDPRLARDLCRRWGKVLDRYATDIFAEDPLALTEEIRKIGEQEAPPLECQNLNGFGLAIMQTPKADDGRAMWMYYGRNTGHGHRDRLNIGLYAENLAMLPDLGYPEYASGRPMDRIWERNSIAHNTVIVDDTSQVSSYTGHLRIFEPGERVKVIEAESDGIYKSANTFRRLSALVDASDKDGYIVDFFRVRGGRLHRQSWHGPPGEVKTTGLNLIKQEKGTFAGEDIEFNQLPKEWASDCGYMYLYDVQRDKNPPKSLTLDYDAIDLRKRIQEGKDPHLRLTVLTETNEVALAHGDPPQNKGGNPRNLDYAILTRTGENLESLYITVVEPYNASPIIESARTLEIKSKPTDQMVGAVEVKLVNGRTDIFLCCESPGRVELANGIVMNGAFGMVSLRNDKVEFARLIAGTELRCKDLVLECPAAEITGKVVSMDTTDPNDNRVVVTLDGEASDALVGKLIVFENDREQDAAYLIRRIQPKGANFEISTGDSTLIRGYADRDDFTKGYILNVREGDALRIPMSTSTEMK